MKILFMIFSFAFISAPVFAKDFEISDTVKKKGGITYLCSGIGESKNDPRVSSFPLKIVFATNSGALYSDVNVRIYDEQKKAIFENFCDGAWLLVQLSPGAYAVTATDPKGLSRSCNVNVATSQTQCTLRWPD